MSIRARVLDALEELYGGEDRVVRGGVQMNGSELKEQGELFGLYEEDESTEATQYGRTTIPTWPVVVEHVRHLPEIKDLGYRAAQRRKSETANEMLAALRDDPRLQNYSLGGLCQNLTYTGGGVVYPEETQDIVAAFIRLNVAYDTVINRSDAR